MNQRPNSGDMSTLAPTLLMFLLRSKGGRAAQSRFMASWTKVPDEERKFLAQTILELA